MKYLLIFLAAFLFGSPDLIFDFDKNTKLRNWFIVDDVVMGGRSFGTFSVSEDGYGVFEGDISLENNGGFSSVRYRTPRINLEGNSKIRIRLKGDGKPYEFRIKHNRRVAYSYVKTIRTSGDWEEIEIDLNSMYPTFRGYRLNRPNFDHNQIEEITFLFGNKRPESFRLLIDKLELVE